MYQDDDQHPEKVASIVLLLRMLIIRAGKRSLT
jgi:hypothetical protein